MHSPQRDPRTIAPIMWACLFSCGIGFCGDALTKTDSAGVKLNAPVELPDSAKGTLLRESPANNAPAQTLTADSLHPSAVTDTVTPNPSFDTLAGPLPDRVKADSVPYLVIGDIEVPVNKTVTVEPGAVFLFKNFTGLRVQGKLIALGTKERPIVFTSENDRSVNPASKLYPNPYDWNGIYIHSDGQGSCLAFCIVSYSVYGIRSDTKFIRLDPIKLRFNGKNNVVVEGKKYQAIDRPFSYVLSTKDATVDGIPAKLLRDPLAIKRNVLRFSSYTVALGGVAGGIYSGITFLQAKKDLQGLRGTDPNGTEAAALRDRRDSYLVSTVVHGVIGALGIAGFWWSFTF
jgi:hypothetical protein